MLDVVYNHTAERRRARPDAVSFRGLDNASYYRLAADEPQPLRELHRLRQHARPAPSARAADGDGQPCATGCSEMHVDGFRFDLAPVLGRTRPRLRPPRRRSSRRSRRTRCWRGVKLIAEPWDIGPRRLPARPVSGAAGWSGTTASATRVRRFWLAATCSARRVRAPLCGVRRPVPATRPRRPPRRSTTSSSHDGFTLRDLVSYDAQAQRGQRRGQPRRPRRTTSAGTAASKGPPTTPQVQRAAARAAARPARHAAAVAGHADAAGRRRTRAHPARQQQRLLPGQPDSAGSTGPRRRPPARVRRRADRLAARAACAAAGQWLDDHPHADGRREVQWLAPARTATRCSAP